MIQKIISHISSIKKLYHRRHEIYRLEPDGLYFYTYTPSYELLYKNANLCNLTDKPYLFPFKKTSKIARNMFINEPITRIKNLFHLGCERNS